MNYLNVCVCVVLCVHVCVPCACKCGAQRATCITLILNFYNQGLSLNPHFTDLTRLSGQQAPGISSYFSAHLTLTRAGITHASHFVTHAWLFHGYWWANFSSSYLGIMILPTEPSPQHPGMHINVCLQSCNINQRNCCCSSVVECFIVVCERDWVGSARKEANGVGLKWQDKESRGGERERNGN